MKISSLDVDISDPKSNRFKRNNLMKLPEETYPWPSDLIKI
jgi:hypothetical protein